MTRTHYTDTLYELDQQVLKMGVLVMEALKKAIMGLCGHDMAQLEKVRDADTAVNKLEFEIDDRCAIIIATEQPVAQDLRHLISTLKIVTQLERMGDHAASIAKSGMGLSEKMDIVPLGRVKEMADVVTRMIDDILTAFIDADAEKAMAVCAMDDKVDSYRQEIHTEIIKMAQKPEISANETMRALFINRFLERMADQVTNIAEWIVFDVTGSHQELNPS